MSDSGSSEVGGGPVDDDAAAGKSAQSTAAASGAEVADASLWGDAWRHLRRSPLFVVSATLLAIVIVMAIFPQLFTSADPRDCNLSRSLVRPSSDAWFGYDVLGCDYYARTVYGARASIAVGLTVAISASIIAVILGSLAGFYRGWIDSLLSRATDVVFALPTLLAGIVILSVMENRGIPQVAFVLSILGWPTMLRLMRATVMSVAETDYVQSARALGAGDLRIITRHVLPNALTPVIVYATIFVGIIITAEAALTFLGVGLQLPAISWGLAISNAQSRLLQAPHLLFFPGLFLSVTVFSFILMGDALRDALDPKLR
ncbi:MAG: ABC transporter permease [Nitriliruptor sp.]